MQLDTNATSVVIWSLDSLCLVLCFAQHTLIPLVLKNGVTFCTRDGNWE
jgi:hypothetical protein